MGCKHSLSQDESDKIQPSLSKSMFVSTGILGEGGFGKVLAAMFVKNGQWYAIKEIKKVICKYALICIMVFLFLL